MTDLSFIHLRKVLKGDQTMPVWPPGVAPASFKRGDQIEEAHALLVEAYKLGGGQVGPVHEWWSDLERDPEFDPTVFFLAIDETNRIVDLAQCWTSAFLKDLAVAEAWRRRGVGQALVLHAFSAFRARGAERFDLKVKLSNPSGAIQLYQRLGMRPVD